MPGYTVVQFTSSGNGKSALAVPASWLITKNDKLMCFFPKTNAKQAIKKLTPARADWELYDVRRLAFKDIPTYSAAMKKQNKAMLTSGVDTEDEHGVEQCKLKRKQNHERLKIAANDCEASDSSDGQ